ncbi:hypothetical protein, partial [Lactobacillus delbrueckii]|uniref:hypothetical protein n=1 Tax=Lactobacillus delbrueckii TaxID=1584 RepID=UPI001E3E74A7
KQISSNGRERRLQSNIFKLDAFHDSKEKDDFGIYGVIKNKRIKQINLTCELSTKIIPKQRSKLVVTVEKEDFKVISLS